MRIAAFLLFVMLSPLGAQSRTARTSTELRATPSARAEVVGVVQRGVRVRVDNTSGRFSHVVLEGYVVASGVRRASSGTVRVTTRDRLSLRAGRGTSADLLAMLTPGTTLAGTAARTGWIRVRRGGWVASSALETEKTVARATTASRRASESKGDVASARSEALISGSSSTAALSAPARTTARDSVVARPAPRISAGVMPDSTLTPSRATTLRSGPDGASLGTISPGATLTPITRDRDWVRVRIEGWVPERDLRPTDSTLATALSAADLRANPDATRGRIVRWTVQVLALQVADPLRKDLEPGENYFLARGPGEENALLYLAVPANLLEQARRMPTLAPLMITARVRSGRSQPAGVPVLDLLSIAK